MRPIVIITLLLAGIAGLAVILFLKPPINHPEPAANSIIQAPVSAPEPKPAISQALPVTDSAATATPNKPVDSHPVVVTDVTGENAAYIQEQINRLEDLEANDDDASLQAILKELTNTNPIIRHVAIEATIQFGGHTAVPVLQDLATRTWNPKEKQELLDAAEFLALPTWSEVRAQKEKERMLGTPPQE